MNHALRIPAIFLQKREVGLIVPVLCTMRLLGEGDIDAVEFHRRITNEIGDPGVFAEHHTIAESIRGEGAVSGIYAGKLLPSGPSPT